MGAVEEAKLVLEELNKKIAEGQEQLKKLEEAKAEQIISGKSEAGVVPPPQKSSEEILREDINRRLQNTGFRI